MALICVGILLGPAALWVDVAPAPIVSPVVVGALKLCEEASRSGSALLSPLEGVAGSVLLVTTVASPASVPISSAGSPCPTIPTTTNPFLSTAACASVARPGPMTMEPVSLLDRLEGEAILDSVLPAEDYLKAQDLLAPTEEFGEGLDSNLPSLPPRPPGRAPAQGSSAMATWKLEPSGQFSTGSLYKEIFRNHAVCDVMDLEMLQPSQNKDLLMANCAKIGSLVATKC